MKMKTVQCLSEEENAAKDAITAKIKDTFEWISTPGKDMRLMYHNFGIVRENKELIRHRMFMTKLKDRMRGRIQETS